MQSLPEPDRWKSANNKTSRPAALGVNTTTKGQAIKQVARSALATSAAAGNVQIAAPLPTTATTTNIPLKVVSVTPPAHAGDAVTFNILTLPDHDVGISIDATSAQWMSYETPQIVRETVRSL